MARNGRSKTLPLGLLAALLLAPAPRPAAAQVAEIPAAAPATPAALKAHAALKDLRRDIRLHLDGRASHAVESLDARLRAVEESLADRALAPAEARVLRAEVLELRGLLAQSRVRAQRRAAAARPRASAAPAGVLGSAAAAPASGRAFDGSSARSGAVVQASAASFAPAEAAPAAARAAVRSDLRLTVPALSGAAAAPASVEMPVADLLAAGAGRGALALAKAKALLSALGKPDRDGLYARALGDFLRDLPEYRPADAVAVRLSADGANHYRLIFDRAGGARRIIAGQFLAATSRDGRPAGMAFIVMGAVEQAADGTAVEDHPGYWREYATDGGRSEWSAKTRGEDKGWGPWKHRVSSSDVVLTAQAWKDERWQDASAATVKTVAGPVGKSWFGRASQAVMDAPVAGHILKFCDKTATSLYTGIMGAPQIIAAKAFGSDMYSIEAGGSYAKNPFINLFVSDQGHIDRLSDGARRELARKVLDNRRAALEAAPFPIAPELKRRAVGAPISAAEAAATLRDDFGAGTYGKRMLHAAADLDGWGSKAMIAGGIVTGVFENVAEGVMNPILWATLGTGHAAAALKGTHAAVTGAVGAHAAVAAVQSLHAVATTAWWVPWLLNATDNTGKVVQLTAEGKFDKEYFKKLGDTGADALYMFVIP